MALARQVIPMHSATSNKVYFNGFIGQETAGPAPTTFYILISRLCCMLQVAMKQMNTQITNFLLWFVCPILTFHETVIKSDVYLPPVL